MSVIPQVFIEKWLAECINVEHEPFDDVITMVSNESASKLKKVIDRGGYGVFGVLNSSIAGMRIVAHRLWVEPIKFDEFTNQDAKVSDYYSNGVMNSIINLENFESKKEEIAEMTREVESGNTRPKKKKAAARPKPSILDEPAIEAEPTAELEEIPENNSELFQHIDKIASKHPGKFCDGVTDEKQKECFIIGWSGDSLENIQNEIPALADALDKNIIYTDDKSIYKELMEFAGINDGSTLIITSFKHHKDVHEKENIVNGVCFNEQFSSQYSYTKDINYFDRVFRDTFTNVIFAFQKDCTIYTSLNFTNNKCKGMILEHLKLSLTLPYQDIVDGDRQLYEALLKTTEENYLKTSVEDATKILRDLKVKRDEFEAEYKRRMDEALRSCRKFNDHKEQVENFDEEKMVERKRAEAMTVFKEVADLDKVKNITFDDNGYIHIYTHNIYVVDERTFDASKDPEGKTGTWHDIGTFDIRIKMFSGSYSERSTITIYNTKHQIKAYSNDRMQAPHVFKEGNMCHGNVSQQLINAYGKKDLFTMVMTVLLFLQSANTSDAAGKHVDKWPKVSYDVATGKESNNPFGEITEVEQELNEELDIPLIVN
jgi:hypothetical protein